MKVGFLTNSLSPQSLSEIKEWIIANNFKVVEVGPSVKLDEKDFLEIKSSGIEILSFIYCRNFLSDDENERETHLNNLYARIEMASKIGTKYVTISTGKKEDRDIEENLPLVKEFLTKVLEYAQKKNVIISLENCPGMGNIAISPYMWRLLFKELPAENLRITFDPSHLVWQFIDYYKALEEFVDKVAYLHIKDTEIIKDQLSQKGILHNHPHPHGNRIWWRHRLPGWGEINWKKIITILKQANFKGVLSIEHEDPFYHEDKEQVKIALLKSKEYIENLIF